MTSNLPTLKIEEYFDKYEFSVKHLLCASDAESLTMKDLMEMADDECKDLWENLKFSYTAKNGHPLLRKEIAALHGVDDEEVQVMVPQEAIYIAMHCLVEYIKKASPDGKFHAIATYPAYQSLYQNLENLECPLDHWTGELTEKGWTFDIDKLKEILRPDTKLLVVNFPHNPTGFVPTQDEWTEIISICNGRGIILFSDEMYRMTHNDGSPDLPSACSVYDNAIVLSGVSKSFALAGLRIGWLCTKNKTLYGDMARFKHYITICPPAPCEILSIIALRNKDRVIKHTMDIVKTNLPLVEVFMNKHTDIFEWYPPKAGTTGFLKLRGWILKLGEGGAVGFCDILEKKSGVLLLPGKVYNFDDSYVRIGFGRANIQPALDALEEFINENVPKY